MKHIRPFLNKGYLPLVYKDFNKWLIAFLLSICVFIPQSAKAQLFSGSNNITSADVVSTQVTINTSKAKDAIAPACRQVVFDLLFRGIPETEYSTPLLSTNEDEWFSQFGSYFNQLLDEKQGRYSSFVTSTYVLAKGKDQDGKKFVSLQVAINVKALRLDLENHNIKRRFGF